MDFNITTIVHVKQKIALAIKTLRKKENLSQAELATLLVVSRITIQNLESGKNFTIDVLLKALQYFNLLEEVNTQIDTAIETNKNTISLY